MPLELVTVNFYKTVRKQDSESQTQRDIDTKINGNVLDEIQQEPGLCHFLGFKTPNKISGFCQVIKTLSSERKSVATFVAGDERKKTKSIRLYYYTIALL